MGRRLLHSASVLGLLLLGACERLPEVKTPATEPAPVRIDSSNMRALPDFEARIAARAARHDTAVIGHSRLQDALPDSIAGYRKQIDEAATFHALQFTFSEASKVFYNARQDYVEFTIGDYVQNPDFFRVSLQRYNLAMGVEISGIKDEKRPAFSTVEGVAAPEGDFAWASYNSRKHVAWYYIGIGDRIFVTIEATGQEGFLDRVDVEEWLDLAGLVGDEP